MVNHDEKERLYHMLVEKRKACNPDDNPNCSNKVKCPEKDNLPVGRYMSLVNVAEAARQIGGDDLHIGPRSALHNNLDASVLIVLQDFGTVGNYQDQYTMQKRTYGEFKGHMMPEIRKDGWDGKEGRTPTTNHLEWFIQKLIGNDFTFNEVDQKNRVFITNSCLCLKNEVIKNAEGAWVTDRSQGYKSGSFGKKWSTECCQRFLHNGERTGLIDIISPKVVLGIGKHATEGVLSSYGRKAAGDYYSIVKDNQNGIRLDGRTRFFPVFHTSDLGAGQRSRLSIELHGDDDDTMADWRGVIRYYKTRK